MKKLLVLALTALLVLGIASISMAAITTSGEMRFDYSFFGWGGDNQVFSELGLYNNVSISDSVSAYFGMWYEVDSGNDIQQFNPMGDDAVTFKIGDGSLKVGYGNYNVSGPFDMLGADNSWLEHVLADACWFRPGVELLYSQPVGDSFTFRVGYFRDNLGVAGDEGGAITDAQATGAWCAAPGEFDAYTLQGCYTSGPLAIDLLYLQPYGGSDFSNWSSNPGGEYLLDASYKIGDMAKVYIGYVGADRCWDNFGYVNAVGEGGVGPTNPVNSTTVDNFTMVGANVTVGNFFAEVEDVVSAPSGYEYSANGSSCTPFGIFLKYKVADNTNLQLDRAINTAGTRDRTLIQLDVAF